RRSAPLLTETIADDGMSVSARLVNGRILPGTQEHNLAVTIRAPAATEVAIGRPALSLLRQLDERDAFTVVTYSSSSETVIPMERATDANKAAARAAIETIDDDGGTCISCGLESGAGELAHSPVEGGLRRILLISDGQANEGLY